MTHRFEVWAPTPNTVRLHLDGELHPMHQGTDGWWYVDVDAAPDSRYAPTAISPKRLARNSAANGAKAAPTNQAAVAVVPAPV